MTQLSLVVPAAALMPGEDTGHPVLEFSHISVQRLPGSGDKAEVLVKHGEFLGGHVLELPHPGDHQVMDNGESGRTSAARRKSFSGCW
jgi:hypothetical protein